ncbi:MAG: hypothetical protein LBT62_08675 [Deltaproteobacteria bacterium]|jgi:hypothetical protein|nr:hypothetical protein [Deltaproteobacteria bacterium]
MEIDVFGKISTGLIFHNPELEAKQIKDMEIDVSNTNEDLSILAAMLDMRASAEIVKGKKPTIAGVKKEVKKILKTEYMKDVFKYVMVLKNDDVLLNHHASADALEKIRADVLGKTALFTDRSDSSNEEIVGVHLSAASAEQAFRRMNDGAHLASQPTFQWNCGNISAHLLTWAPTYRLRGLLAKESADEGLRIGIDQLIEEMSAIQNTVIVGGEGGDEKMISALTFGGEIAEKATSIYELERKYPIKQPQTAGFA